MLIQNFHGGLDPREKKKYYFEETLPRRVLTQLARLAFHTAMVIEDSGVELLPGSGAVVLAANHLTDLDGFVLQFALARPIFFMAKAELHQNPVLDPILRQLGSFPIHRGVRDAWAFEHAHRVLEHGQVLGIFPEGQRSQGAGLRPAKTGAARLALDANCPLLPVAISGTQALFQGFPRRARVQVRFGSPIYPSPDDTALALTDRVMFDLAALLPPELRGVYSQKPDWL
jgi:1-acyl-sn-glycerol-3-phosphate acyltransferase